MFLPDLGKYLLAEFVSAFEYRDQNPTSSWAEQRFLIAERHFAAHLRQIADGSIIDPPSRKRYTQRGGRVIVRPLPEKLRLT